MFRKLRPLKNTFKDWNKNDFGNVHENVNKALSMVDQIQQQISSIGFSDELHEAEIKAQLDLQKAFSDEEYFWKQKARIDWFSQGDRNTAYFHRIAKIRSASKQMTLLKHGDQVLVDRQQIEQHVLDFYTSLYTSENSFSSNDWISKVIPSLVSSEDNIMLTALHSLEEVKSAVFSKCLGYSWS